ncbi:TonB-dependent receptor [Thermococcus henrietii]|uniref:TonB-dependent receptor n=1 Tax=Thermococcus henrietii TaxID=2016361 RepID=UPI000C0761CA|nr:TonB-dependent receptor [Thermococcus henrietii]
MGHTLYYTTVVRKWKAFVSLMERVSTGLGYGIEVFDNALVLNPGHPMVEPLRIEKEGQGFAKTNLIEPHHSIYILILHSVSAFGSVELWED